MTWKNHIHEPLNMLISQICQLEFKQSGDSTEKTNKGSVQSSSGINVLDQRPTNKPTNRTEANKETNRTESNKGSVQCSSKINISEQVPPRFRSKTHPHCWLLLSKSLLQPHCVTLGIFGVDLKIL